MRRIVRLLGPLCSVACLVTLPGDARGALPAETRAVSDENITYTSYVAPEEPSGPVVILGGTTGRSGRRIVSGLDPTWSPDGEWIAYTKDYDIWRVRADGSRDLRVAHVPGRLASEATWSPDGRRLAFTGSWYTASGEDDETEHHAVYIARRDGSQLRRLRSNASSPTWSPSGRLIAFRTEAGVAAVRPNGGGFRRLSDAPVDIAPMFSPNGRHLLMGRFVDSTAAPLQISTLDVSTHQEKSIPTRLVPGYVAAAGWTPRNRIAYIAQAWTRMDGLTPGAPSQLFTMRRDGARRSFVTSLADWAVPGYRLSWRPPR